MAKILIIEDEKLIRELLQEFFNLVRKGETIEAENAMEGVGLAIREKPDIIFCDIGLPDISGLEIIRQLRNNNAAFKKTRIIAMSAEHDHKNKALEVGADAFLRKPFSISDIEQALNYDSKGS